MHRLLFVFALFFSFNAVAQDVIVRITGDTLHVKIESTNDSFIYYRSAETKRKDLEIISRKEVAEMLYRFEKPNAQLERASLRSTRGYELIQIWISFSGYFLPNTGIPENEFEDYYTNLQWGKGLNTGVNFFFNKQLGLGVIYSSAQFSNRVPVTMGNTGVSGYLSDNLSLQYFGAGIAVRFSLGNSGTNLLLGAGAGMNYYNNDAEIIYGYNLKSNGLGFHLNGSINIELGGGLYIPVKLSYVGNTVSEFKLKTNDNMPEDLRKDLELSVQTSENFSVTRISLSAGLLFAF